MLKTKKKISNKKINNKKICLPDAGQKRRKNKNFLQKKKKKKKFTVLTLKICNFVVNAVVNILNTFFCLMCFFGCKVIFEHF